MSDEDKGKGYRHFEEQAENTVASRDHVQTRVDTAAEGVQQALAGLPANEQKQALARSGVLPDQVTANDLWQWVVGTFCAIAAIAGVAIALVGLGLTAGSANAQILLTVFTTTVGFLAGLFAPSPVGKDGA